MTEYAFEGVKQATSTVTWSFATQTVVTDQAIPFSDPIDPAYQATIQAAFARWAAVSGLTFVQVPDTPTAAIRIGFGLFYSPAIVGQTYLRSNGAGTLTTDTVVRLLDPVAEPLANQGGTWTYADFGITLLQVATHELGHALGLDHTTDPATTMYRVATAQNTALAPGDVEGINALYPLYTVQAATPMLAVSGPGTTADTFTITRYGDPSAPLQLNYAVTGAPDPAVPGSLAATAADFAGNALPAGPLIFAPGVSTVTLSLPIAGNTQPQPDRGFSLALAAADGSPITVRGTTVAAILEDDGAALLSSGSIGIFRFFSTGDGSQFLTASLTERNTLIATRPDLTYEGLAMAAIADPATDPAATPIYRFFDTRSGTHFFTASPSERDAVQASRPDLTFEGTSFYEDATPGARTQPVYRFFDTATGTHFYTEDPGERATLIATRSDLHDEGVSFYAPLI